MAGYDAPFVVGYDCHGLPIELQVDRELGPKKRQMSVADFCRACRAYAERFIGTMTEQFQRLGILGTWDDPYVTMNFKYQAAIARAFGRFVEQGSSTRARSRSTGAFTAGPRSPKPKSNTRTTSSPSIYVEFPLAPTSAASSAPRCPASLAGRVGADLDDDAVDDSVESGDRVSSGASTTPRTTSTAAP
jgi:isoleucyl-tRNA synthetase